MVMALTDTTDTTPDHLHGQLGPYETWMLDAGKVYDLPGLMLEDEISLSCIAEFARPIDPASFATDTALTLGRFQSWVSLPTLHATPGFTTRFIPLVLAPASGGATQARILSSTAGDITDLFGQGALNPDGPLGAGGQLRLNFPIRQDTLNPGFAASLPAPGAVDPALGGAAPKVIVAIIDLGIPFAHARFRHAAGTGFEAGTRIDYCWAQSAPAEAGSDPQVLFGREFTRPGIDAMVSGLGGDEDAVYRLAGLLGQPDAPPQPLDRRMSHGSHTLDLLAGGWDPATAAGARIIAVDLPASSTWETSGFGKDMFLLSALHYIFDRAARIRDAYGCADLPLVINLSYGYSGGPHDGSGLIEDAMAELVTARNAVAPTALVMPSGNLFQDRLFAQITDGHFQVTGPGVRAAMLHWFAPPCDRTSSYLEIWYPQGTDPADVRIVLTPPGGVALSAFAPAAGSDGFAANLEIGGRIVGQFTIDRHRRLSPRSRVRATVILAPTEPPADISLLAQARKPHGPAPAGLWEVRFEMPAGQLLPPLRLADGSTRASPGIECRIQCDTSYGQGNTGAKQGYFVDPHNPMHDETGKLAAMDWTHGQVRVRRFGSLNGMSTAASTLVVGGHVIASGKAAVYSGAGAALADHSGSFGRGVDVSAPCDRSAFAPGMVAAGTRSGVTVAAQGTSTAAPQIARALAAALMTERATDVPGFLYLLMGTPDMVQVLPNDDSPAGVRRLGAFRLARPDPGERG